MAFQMDRRDRGRTSVTKGLGPKKDSTEMDPVELRRRLALFASRAKRGQPLFEPGDRPSTKESDDEAIMESDQMGISAPS